ncbi:MAG: hypothetical protein NTY04_02240 [Candidatus Staskawiczbacteria bacterium]|nr:hypothetical protein [Candidatus Staskawiczbacteria bacterium]
MAKDKEKGVSLIITFFIMIIILSVVLSLSIILYSEIKVLRNMGNSVVSFYAADSGIEKVLYYDRQVIESATVASLIAPTRGLCSVFDLSANPSYCQTGTGSVNCNNQSNPVNVDCGINTCTNCSISFSATLDDNGTPLDTSDDKTYTVTASVNSGYYLDIMATGKFNGIVREAEAYTLSKY